MPATFAGLACARRVASSSGAVTPGYSTLTRNSPLAGAVGAALRRQRRQIVDVALARLDQRAHEIAHHVLQEAAAADAVDQPSRGSFQHRRKHASHFGLSFGIAVVGGGEGGEIVLAFEAAASRTCVPRPAGRDNDARRATRTGCRLPPAECGIRRFWPGHRSADGNSGTSSAESTRMAGGSRRLTARRRLGSGMGFAMLNAATCSSACTPASVRPEPATCTAFPSIPETISSSTPWMVGRPGCTCQP